MDSLILALAEKSIFVSIADGNLVVNAPKGALNDELVIAIKNNKEALVKYLSGDQHDKGIKQIDITPTGEQPHYELSSSQRRLWVLSHFREANVAYNMPGAFLFEGSLDAALLGRAIATLIERHESLRTIFRTDDYGEVKQFIRSPAESGFKMQFRDISELADPESRLAKIIEEEYAAPFDLASGPLIRAALYKYQENKWLFTYTLHHIISDGWSMEVLMRELMLIYNAYRDGKENPLPALRIQYKDYAAWQQELLKDPKLAEHKAWWMNQFNGELPVLALDTGKQRPALVSYNGAIECRTIKGPLLSGLKHIGMQENASLFMCLVGLTYVILYKYAGQQDIVIGTTTAGRDHSDLEEQIGFYVNTVPLRIRGNGTNSFRELLRSIRQLHLEAYEHQGYPFDELVNELGIRPDSGRNPLFDVLIELRDKYRAGEFAGSLQDTRVSAFEGNKPIRSKFDLTFFFTEAEDGLNLLMEYNSDIIGKELAQQMIVHAEQLIAAITEDPGLPLNRLEYLTDEERKKLILGFNDTRVDFSPGESILSLFAQQVRSNPEAIALQTGYTTVSYRELDEKSNQLAGYLIRDCNVVAGSLVGIMLNRSEKLIISLLGILKAGAAYVPIDPGYPAERKKYILDDTAPAALITQSDYIFELPGYTGTIFAADIQWDVLEEVMHYEPLPVQAADAAYVIYTSGSTGQPKGCMVSRANLLNYIKWANDHYFKDGVKANFGLYSSLSFDLTVTSIFCPLTQGGKIYIYEQHQELSGIFQHSLGAGSGINAIKLTPSHVSFLEHFSLTSSEVSVAILGGEEVTGRQVTVLKRINPSMQIYNEYGPTEATVGCVVSLLQEHEPVVIGKPAYNTAIYILDADGALCPPGVAGEIIISGNSVAMGYLNKTDLTNGKFVGDPFMKGKMMYRTGDIGRWLPDGNLVFMGRKDDQVKVRGYRVETGEIAAVLKKHPAVKDAVVLAIRAGDGNNFLAAFVVAAEEQNGHLPVILGNFLNAQLPAWMIPHQITAVNEIPLTQNGKADKAMLVSLQAGQAVQRRAVYIAPRNSLEEKLVAIWEEVLGKENIGVRDSFFDLGGHSLSATRLIARISKEFDMSYSFDALFNEPTIEHIACEIEKTNWVNKDVREVDNISNTEKYLI